MSVILIVEDNDKNLKLVRDVLQVKGYDTLEAGTAEEGIGIATERIPDLILMDIQLPGMNGIEALEDPARESGDGRHSGDRGDGFGDAAGPQPDHRSGIRRATSASRSISRNFWRSVKTHAGTRPR